MKIVINGRFTAQPATGVQRVSHEITHALDRLLARPAYRHMRVRLVVPREAGTGLSFDRVAVELAAGGTGHAWEQLVLPRYVRDGTLLCLGNSAPVETLLRGAPVAVMLHDQAYRLFPRDYSRSYRVFHGAIERLILRYASLVISVSETERRTLLATNRVKCPIIVAPNGSWMRDRPVTIADRRPPTPDSYGLYVGSFSERKNVEAVLATAVALARTRGRPFRFVGPANAMTATIRTMVPADVRHLIRFDGYLPDAALADLYDHADFLLYPSFYEASGLPPSEAMTFGCPVILSDLPVLRERCGDAAVYCDPHDHAAFIAAACCILDDPAAGREMSRRGRERVQALTWERQAEIILDGLTARAPIWAVASPPPLQRIMQRPGGEALPTAWRPHAPK